MTTLNSTPLQELLDRVVAARDSGPGAMLYVDAPRFRFQWCGASGVVDKRSDMKLTPRHPLRVASNTKTFVAVAILRLAEVGLLNIDESIEACLSPESTGVLASGGYITPLITIRHLLSHTSGIFDYGMAAPYDRLVRDDPTRRWTRAEQLRGAIEWGQPYGRPGQLIAYSDTGYILLGEILESITQKGLAAALRELVGYEELGLESTWMESQEPPPPAALSRAHQYLDGEDIFDWDPSMDLFGGGGLISTVTDLGRFFRATFTGQVYENPETLKTMLTPVPVDPLVPSQFGISTRFGLGVRIIDVDGLKAYAHGGFWGTRVGFVPALDLAVASATTGGGPGSEEVFRKTIEIIRTWVK